MNLLAYYNQEKLTDEDKKARDLFLEHRNEFPLDEGSLEDRYRAAQEFQRKYFFGTRYKIDVETYCVNCTVTTIRREQSVV